MDHDTRVPKVTDIQLTELKGLVHDRYVAENTSVERCWFDETIHFLRRLGYSLTKDAKSDG